jgi:ABC-type multidrug transport system fused ATPase/permease subunit
VTLGVAAAYQARKAAALAARDRLVAEARRIVHARFATFGLIVATAYASTTPAAAPWRLGLIAGGALLLGIFVWLARRHTARKREIARLEILAEVQQAGSSRLARAWEALPNAAVPALDRHPFAADLDVFGRASLRQLLGTVTRAPGEATLTSWLLAPAPPDVVRERQAAARELAALADFRDTLAVNAVLAGSTSAAALDRMLAWAEDEPWLSTHGWLIWLARAMGVATSIALGTWLTHPHWPGLWAPLAGANLVIVGLITRRTRAVYDRASAGSRALSHYAHTFGAMAHAPFAAPLLTRLRTQVTHGETSAAASIRRLARLTDTAEIRFSPMMHVALNAITLFDVHVVAGLERWQRDSGRQARPWFGALGEVEALAALGTLAADHPDWAFPELVDGPARLEATALGTPLVPDGACVRNDVAVGPPGTFLLVTGSNMSGKSTLLRSIGANVVLAQIGAPVCAGSLRLTPLAPWTSMRVEDSLVAGVSLFMAELLRLKEVVEAARGAHAAAGREVPVLFLIDEMLHGTNTAERRTAARHVLAHLVEHGAIGAVTTHDLSLADAPELAPHTVAVHFSEQFTADPNTGDTRMTFDYRLRPGIATSTNALKLVEMMGLIA